MPETNSGSPRLSCGLLQLIIYSRNLARNCNRDSPQTNQSTM
ncbi:uncharacterized protein CTRU02_212475 [Colletotrichum truncatum]|uniref:Uncharacterized protein n=1 Tax=Colletotrichum truncatum TaxID=5467 RepID=A0ACC3YQS2_COLTU